MGRQRPSAGLCWAVILLLDKEGWSLCPEPGHREQCRHHTAASQNLGTWCQTVKTHFYFTQAPCRAALKNWGSRSWWKVMCRVAEPSMPWESGAGKTKSFAVPACLGHQVTGIQQEGSIAVPACQLCKDQVAKVLKAVVSQVTSLLTATWVWPANCQILTFHTCNRSPVPTALVCVFVCLFVYVHQSSKVRAPRSCSASLPLSQRKIFFAAFSMVMFSKPLGYHRVMH